MLTLPTRVYQDVNRLRELARCELSIVREYGRTYVRHQTAKDVLDTRGDADGVARQQESMDEAKAQAVFCLARARMFLRAAHATRRYAECGPAIEVRELQRKRR